MLTKYYGTRLAIIICVFVLLLTSCASSAQQTRTAILGQAEALTLLDGQGVEDAAGALYAIGAVVDNAVPGAFMMFNELNQVALFVAPGAQAADGVVYTFIGAVSTEHTAIVNAPTVLSRMGINMYGITSVQQFKDILTTRGFIELSAGAFPALAATLRLGLGYLRTLGATVTDIIVAPAGILTPDALYPWDMPEGVQQ